MIQLDSPQRPLYRRVQLVDSLLSQSSKLSPRHYWSVCRLLLGASVLCGLLLLLAAGLYDRQHVDKIWTKAGEMSTGLRARMRGVPIPSDAWHDADYFIEKGIAPASWERTYNPPTCVQEYAARKRILGSTRPLDEWRKSFAVESGCPSYPIPKGGFRFHMHWEGPWSEELETSIDSFLATQRLSAGHRVTFWYGAETPPPQEVIDHYYSIAPHNLEFKVLDRITESEGTCLAQMPDWNDEETRKAKNMKPASLSNLTRLLLLSKYGGVWVDSDVVFVRDLTDLLRVGPLAPAYFQNYREYGVDGPHFYNNHLYVVGPGPSPVAQRMLHTACRLSYGAENWPEQLAFEPHAGRVFNDGLLQLCERVTYCGLSAFPLSLVESETWTPEPLLKPCRNTTDTHVDNVLQRVWMWHFRNECSRYDGGEDTAYAIVKERLKKALPLNLKDGLGQTLPGAL